VADAPAAAVDVASDPGLTALTAARPVEVVAAVHVANQAARVEPLLEVVASGLVARAGALRAAVLVADAGSSDATADAVRSWCDAGASSRGLVEVAAPRHRGRAILALLRAARELSARAVVLVDADLTGVQVDWIRSLVDPVLREQADYVSPAYARSVSEGTLTTNLLAPLTRALYGARLQQVMGGAAALSGALIESLLAEPADTADWQPHGAELWIATGALATGGRVAEVALGRKTVTPGGPAADLATILVRTVGPLFALMEQYHAIWLDRPSRPPTARLGAAPPVQADAGSPDIDQMVRAFNLGLKDLLPVWEQIIPESTLARLYPLALLAPEEFKLPLPLWARLVSDFAVAFHERRLPREHLLRALTPLYLGRVAAFVVESRATPLDRVPETFEMIDRAFEVEREHLVARWR
jgi:glucosylglycerate synthase